MNVLDSSPRGTKQIRTASENGARSILKRREWHKRKTGQRGEGPSKSLWYVPAFLGTVLRFWIYLKKGNKMQILTTVASSVTCRVVATGFELARPAFPPLVRIETTNACNAKCIICPHRMMTRKVQRMSDQLYASVIDQCAGNNCREVQLHNFGEPLLDKALPERIRYAKLKGIRKVKIFSNGSLFDEKRARALIEAGLNEVQISIDGACKEEYERIRYPLKFDRVIENVKRLVALRDEVGADIRVAVACCSTTDQTATMSSLEDVVDSFSFGKIHNWGGEHDQVSSARQGKTRKPCSRLWRTFTILANGDVALCCLDYDGHHILGRIDEDTSIREIWRGEAYTAVRRKHLEAQQAQIDLCRTCPKSFL